MKKQSLRDIKKEATEQALAQAAYDLALEKGLDGFTVDDVVQRAGYSRRTFANYFSCKEEAVVQAAISFNNFDEYEHLLGNITEKDTPLDILYQLMRARLTVEHLWKIRQLVSLSERYPTLTPYLLSALRQFHLLPEEMLIELTQGRYSKEYIHLLVGAVHGVTIPLIDGSLNALSSRQVADNTYSDMTFEQYLDKAFSYLRNGFTR